MLTIAVLDDEDIYIDRIKRITEEYMNRMGIKRVINVYKNGQDVLTDLKKEKYFDIYLLDMKLPDMNGLEVAKQIRRRSSDSILIYVTHYVDYSTACYEVNAYRYILKTELEEDLPKAYLSMKEALRKKRKCDRFYMVERYGKREKIFYRDIYYLKKEGKYVIIVHKNGESQVRKPISLMLEELQSEEFLMIDRSCAVNIDHVESLKDYEVYIRDGETLPVSRPKWNYVKDMIMNGGESNATGMLYFDSDCGDAAGDMDNT